MQNCTQLDNTPIGDLKMKIHRYPKEAAHLPKNKADPRPPEQADDVRQWTAFTQDVKPKSV